MEVTLVHVHVKPDHIDDFIEATRQNHEGSVKEEGNIRFDVIQSKDDPGFFILYEIFVNKDAIEAHKETTHYLNWRKAVDDWMAQPRKGVTFQGLFPQSLI